MNIQKHITTLYALCMLLFSAQDMFSQKENSGFIDPRIGNVSKFLVPTYPTMQLPNQMLRMFPDKYDYISDQVKSFPLQVHSHRRVGVFKLKVIQGELSSGFKNHKMNIDHDLEQVKPWYYSTYLIDQDITVEFAPNKKSALYRFDFKKKAGANNIIVMGSSAMVAEERTPSSFGLKEKISYTTRGTSPLTREMHVFAYMTFVNENNKQLKPSKVNLSNGCSVFSFDENTVTVKYGISYISIAQAKINFENEIENKTYKDVVKSGKESWDAVMDQIKVKGGTLAQKRTFYTSLYRTYERMVDINEYGSYYSGYDQKVHHSDRSFYVDDWVWDTYRAQHPLRTILSPKVEEDMLHSYVEMYKHSGWLPTFPQVHGNHMCMNSYHSSAIFIDAYRKGLKNYDVESAYEGIKKNLTEGTFIPWRQGLSRLKIDDFFHENGYFPSLAVGEEETNPMVDSFEKRQPVAVTLGLSYDFWTMSELAKELGKTADYEKYLSYGNNYKKLWHPEQRLFMPKDSEGQFLDINPKSAGGLGYRDYYDENNGWTYAWDVQHDIQGLIELLGGQKAAEERLDQLFREPLGKRKSQFFIDGSNSTGMVGQFSMGNEPSFHIPYLYNSFGAPWKTQKKTRFLLDVFFKDDIHGIPGDEDGGGMTAFVVFTSLGIYPVTPGLPFYDITSPVFEKSTIALENGKQFTIIAKGASKKNKYIQKAYINGKEISTPFITHQQIMGGGELKLVLAEKPNKTWGKTVLKPNK